MNAASPRDIDILVRSVALTIARYANLFKRGWLSARFDELVSAGNEGAFMAARRYDPSHGVPFESYARADIVGAMQKQVRLDFREVSPHTKAAQDANASEPAVAVQSASFAEMAEEGPKEATARAVREARFRAQRFAAAMLMASDAPVDAEALFLEKEEIGHAVEVVNRTLAAFTREQRATFQMHHIKGVEQADVAAALSISLSTVKRHLRFVAQGLRSALIEAGVETPESLGKLRYALDHGDDPAKE